MPELPEVEMVRRRIMSCGLHRRIVRTEVRDQRVLESITPSRLGAALKGRCFTDVGRRGKQLFLRLDDGKVLTMHLGMTGDVLFYDDGPEEDHIRLLVHFGEGGMAFEDQRLFGSVGMCGDIDDFLERKGTGPDALDITLRQFVDRMAGRKRAIKTALLDQSIVAGVGNLYADEMLFQCHVHPLTPVMDLSEGKMRCLHKAMQEVLNLSIEVGTEFELMPERYLLHDRSPNVRCPRCRSMMTAERINGRTSVFCPRCQKP